MSLKMALCITVAHTQYRMSKRCGKKFMDIKLRYTIADDVALYSGAKICIVIDNDKIYYI